MGGKGSLARVIDISTWEKGHVITRRETASTLSHRGEPQGLGFLHVFAQEAPHSEASSQPACLLQTEKLQTSIYFTSLSFLVRSIYHRGILSECATEAAN